MQRAFALLAKAAASASLVYFAVTSIDLAILGERLSEIKIGWALAAVGLAAVQLFLLAIRWRQITHACGAPLPVGRAFRFSLIGVCFNQALPSGGDAMRIWLFARAGIGWSKATQSVLLDRFIGVLALALIVVTCLPWTLTLIENSTGRVALLLIGLGSLVGAFMFVMLSYVQWCWLRHWAATRHLSEMAMIVRKLLFSAKAGLSVMALSLAIHVLTAIMACCLAQAINAPLGFLEALCLVPPVMLVAAVPISIAGWGVREKSLVWAFALAGLPEADGFLVSVLFGGAMVLLGCIGGVVWLTSAERAERSSAMAGSPVS